VDHGDLKFGFRGNENFNNFNILGKDCEFIQDFSEVKGDPRRNCPNTSDNLMIDGDFSMLISKGDRKREIANKSTQIGTLDTDTNRFQLSDGESLFKKIKFSKFDSKVNFYLALLKDLFRSDVWISRRLTKSLLRLRRPVRLTG
jgi:hypothetical protein